MLSLRVGLDTRPVTPPSLGMGACLAQQTAKCATLFARGTSMPSPVTDRALSFPAGRVALAPTVCTP